ncbi:MAG TPA: NAD-dependent dehydratase, partial [Propionibacteriaceae bacterium]|nr:NAD-dependent dehydratase [Propionibacteriaceae bacterium]
IVSAMASHSIRRIAVVSAAPVGPREEQAFFERRVLMPILEQFFGATYDDMRRMEEVLQRSENDWISVRPPRLLDNPATGSYRIGIAPQPQSRSITYGDLATALLDSLDRPEFYAKAVFVAN